MKEQTATGQLKGKRNGGDEAELRATVSKRRVDVKDTTELVFPGGSSRLGNAQLGVACSVLGISGLASRLLSVIMLAFQICTTIKNLATYFLLICGQFDEVWESCNT